MFCLLDKNMRISTLYWVRAHKGSAFVGFASSSFSHRRYNDKIFIQSRYQDKIFAQFKIIFN